MHGWAWGRVLVVISTILPVMAMAMPGDLDPTFGDGGIVVTSLGTDWDIPYTLLLQDDGSIVAVGQSTYAGDFALVRYRPDGSLDPAFGAGGIVRTDLSPIRDFAARAVIDAEGRIVAAGLAEAGGATRVALARYQTDGQLDPSFGSGGVVLTAVGTIGSAANALALQADGKLVVAGSTSVNLNSHTDIAVLRYLPTSELDPLFGSGGIATTSLGDRDQVVDAFVQPDGRLIIVGSTYSQQDTARNQFAVLRYLADGSLDPTFGVGGVVRTTFTAGVSTYDEPYRAALQPDGKIVVIGRSNTQGYYGAFLLARYRTDGSLDPTFGSGGKVIDTVSTSAIGLSVKVLPDGRLIAAGAVTDGPYWDFGLVRYASDGSRDATFGTAGMVRTAIGPGDNPAIDVVVQPDGRIVAAGYMAVDVVDDFTTDEDFALVRYEGDPSCGNQLISAGETCDDGNATDGDGCTADCQVADCYTCSGSPSTCIPMGQGAPCTEDDHPCTADVCDANGVCTHLAANTGATCRAAAGDCDLAEQCDGGSATCPADDVVGFGVSCRTKTDACDAAEFCDGVSLHCPTDHLAASGTPCRSASDVCDLPEACDGVSPICPPDAKATVLCRAAIDLCDIAESCDGMHDDCPPDTFAPAGTSCRAAVGACDVSETCSGASPLCPSDAHQPDALGCDDGNPCTQTDNCRAGSCVGTDPLDCDDGNPCSADTCSPTGGCINDDSPATGCMTAARSNLLIKQSSDDSKDKLRWKWSRGERFDQTDVADPINGSARYALCVYSGPTSTLVADAALPPGTGWRAFGSKGYMFRGNSPNGLSLALLKGGAASKSKAIAKGKGAALPDPALPLDFPVTVQLKKDGSPLCLESTFTSADEKSNTDTQFKATK